MSLKLYTNIHLISRMLGGTYLLWTQKDPSNPSNFWSHCAHGILYKTNWYPSTLNVDGLTSTWGFALINYSIQSEHMSKMQSIQGMHANEHLRRYYTCHSPIGKQFCNWEDIRLCETILIKTHFHVPTKLVKPTIGKSLTPPAPSFA